MGEKQRVPRNTDDADEPDDRKPAGANLGALGDGPQDVRDGDARLPPPPRDLPRTATEMAPGIPIGSGKGIDEALRQPDSDIGGVVAGDTTPDLSAASEPREPEADGQGREPKGVLAEDKDRTTL